MSTVSVVVPTYNEGANVTALLARLSDSLPIGAEVLFVDDGTDDLPARVAAIRHRIRPHVQVVRRRQPTGGLGGAVLEGIRRSAGDVIVVCDGDLQHPPELIPEMLRAVRRADVVVASRYCDGGASDGLDGAVRRGVSKATGGASRTLFRRRLRNCSDPMSGFFALRRSALDVDALKPQGFKILLEILVRSRRTLRVAEVPFVFGRRTAGESHASVREGMRFARQLMALRLSNVSRAPALHARARGGAPLVLPSPPTDAERVSYLGPQRRWVFAFFALSFLSIMFSIVRFSMHAGLYFLAPYTVAVAAFAVSLRSSTRRRRVDLHGHEALVAGYRRSRLPSVDVFLPSAGEPIEVLANTFGHVRALQWGGHLTVRVLDDSARPHVEVLARTHGFQYSVRADRPRLKKAGNLAAGYKRSAAQFIVIFDADFVPRPDFLQQLMPYFDDPSVGVVQSPQYFDTDPSMNWLQRFAGATQELFYRFIQPSRDAVGAAICVGTCAIYRRSALSAAGGFAQIGHSEDVHTGVRVLAAGYQLRYVPVAVSKGICPDTVNGFLNQQYRWCFGSMSLLRDRTFHQQRTLTLRQRMCFFSGFGYYLATAVTALFGVVPSLTMIWFFPNLVHPINSVWLIPTVLNWFVVLPLLMKKRWRFGVIRVQMLYSFAHVVAIFHTITGRSSEWVATGSAVKGTPLSTTIKRVYRTWLVTVLVLTWPRLIVETTERGVSHYWAMLVLATIALAIQLPVLFAGDARTAPVVAPVRRRALGKAAHRAPSARRAVLETA